MQRNMLDSDYLVEILMQLLELPSPSGYTDAVVHYTGEKLRELGIPFELTRRGAIRATLSGEVNSPDRAIVCHLDTLGAMTKNLKANGRLEISPIGFWSPRFAEGARVTIFRDNGTSRGTILPLKASGHTFNEEIDIQPVSWENLEVRVDEHVSNQKELETFGFNVGDFIAIDATPEVAANGFINARHLDNKAGVATLLTAAKYIIDHKCPLPVDCHLLFTISEEIGSGASAILHGDVAEMVSVDNATPAPGQNSSEFGVTIAMKDSSGPFDWHLTHKLIDLCSKNEIPHQRDVFKHYRCDAASAIEAGNDLRTALICFAVDASHGYERTHRESLEALGTLLVNYVQSRPTFMRDRDKFAPLQGFSTQPVPHDDELPPPLRLDMKEDKKN